jgi:hypothetical protein
VGFAAATPTFAEGHRGNTRARGVARILPTRRAVAECICFSRRDFVYSVLGSKSFLLFLFGCAFALPADSSNRIVSEPLRQRIALSIFYAFGRCQSVSTLLP